MLGRKAAWRRLATRGLTTTKPPSININIEKTPITAQLWKRRHEMSVNKVVAPPQTTPNALEFVTKTPSDSRLYIRYNFSTDESLRSMYIDNAGTVGMGKILEDLDAFAGNVAHLHCSQEDPTAPRVNLVTASVDNIVLNGRLKIDGDMVLVGQVCWVGNSSLDVVIAVHSLNSCSIKDKGEEIDPSELVSVHDTTTRLMSSFFTYVARRGIKAVRVNKLNVVSDADKKLFEDRAKAAAMIKISRRAKKALSPENALLATQLINAGLTRCDMPALADANTLLIRDTALANSFITQPQNTNTSGKVFGGYLMHRAYDLAVASCYTFAGVSPVFRECEKVSFDRPVEIGDLVKLTSRVVYASDDSPAHSKVVVEVKYQVVKPEKVASFVSNTFVFVFGFEKYLTMRAVLPTSVEEAEAILIASGSHHP